jgi:uncharacterized damage-inducible protein DinB
VKTVAKKKTPARRTTATPKKRVAKAKRAGSGVKRAQKRAAKPKRTGSGVKRVQKPAAKPKRAAASKKKAQKRAAKPKRATPAKKKPLKAKPQSFPQRASASTKMLVLFEIARGRTAVLAAIQGLVPGSAERPFAPGKWNVRQHVLHLAYWDREFMQAIDDAWRGVLPGWSSNTVEQEDQVNAAALDRLNHLNWDEALRLLHGWRLELLETVEDIPEEPAVVWSDQHALGRLLRGLVWHDRHHADAIKRWRSDTKP